LTNDDKANQLVDDGSDTGLCQHAPNKSLKVTAPLKSTSRKTAHPEELLIP